MAAGYTRYKRKYCGMMIKHFSDMCRNERGEISGIPSLLSFSKEIGIEYAELKRWREEFDEFDEACLICEEQALMLVTDSALCGKVNPSIARLLLKHWLEKGNSDSGKKENGISERERELIGNVIARLDSGKKDE